MSTMQLFPALPPAVEAALRASVERWGVLVPVVVDQHGRILDGHHRSRIAAELGVDCPRVVHNVNSDDEAVELARTLNLDRRHLDAEQRRQLAADLREKGHSLRAIAGALGVSHEQARQDTATVKGLTVPDRVVGLDGKSRPATRPPRTPAPPPNLDRLADDLDDVDEAQAMADTLEAHYGPELTDNHIDQAVIDNHDSKSLPPTPADLRPVPPITKPDLGGGISHPARFSDELIPVFADLLSGYTRVLDPFAGTGRIHDLRRAGHDTVGVEIEPEWATLSPHTIVGDALALPFDDGSFDAICTSPTYGNRLADSHQASDPHLRRSYTHDLGRTLHHNNSGTLQWGDAYRTFHEAAWREAVRVLRPAGLFVLNIKDHVRSGIRQPVAGWHLGVLNRLDLVVVDVAVVATSALRQGTNSDLRAPGELVVALTKEPRR